MLSRYRRSRHTQACNDNGPFSVVRGNGAAPHPTIIRVAANAAGAITLSYVAGGVLMITGTAG